MTTQTTIEPLLESLRVAVHRDHRRRRRRKLAALVAAPVVLLAGVAIAATQDPPWWQDAELPANPTVVDRQLAPPVMPSFPRRADRSRARTVARADGAALVAAPLGETGYCLIPSLPGDPDLGFSCVDRVANADQGRGSQFRGVARPASEGSPRWVVYGRITDPGAAALDLTQAAGVPLSLPLAPGGFFLADVPERRWAALSNRSGKATIVDRSGKTLRTTCVQWGLSPLSEGAGRSRWGSIEEGNRPSGPCPDNPIVFPRAVLAEARMILEVPAGRGTVLRLYVSPSTTGGECEFTLAADAGSTVRPPHMGGGSCSATPRPPQNAAIVMGVGMGRGWPQSTLHGTVLPDLDAARVRIEWATGARDLAFRENRFLAANPFFDPPERNLPYAVVVYDGDGRELARKEIPKDWLYLD